jgi:hypothetical protein
MSVKIVNKFKMYLYNVLNFYCCNGLAVARQWAKPLGPKFKKCGFWCLADPKNGQKPQSKILIFWRNDGIWHGAKNRQ